MNTREFRDFLVKNQDMARSEIVKATGRSSRTVNEMQAKLRIEGLLPEIKTGQGIKRVELTPEQQFALDLEKIKSKGSQSTKQYRIALNKLCELQELYDEMLCVKDSIETYEIKPKGRNVGEAVSVIVASDWHVDEVVTLEGTDNTNQYNPKIAKERAERFFRNAVYLIEKERSRVRINTAVLALIGDFISGEIHEDTPVELLPQDAIIYCMDLIASGIEYMLKHGGLEKLVVPCCVGNHARDTKKIQIAKEHGRNKEWAMYHFLARRFKGDKRVQFVIPRSQFTYIEVYGRTLRFMHGHQGYKYNGGVGGITVPLNKAVSRWNESRKAEITIIGHWHQRIDNGVWMVNGSLIGDAPYGKVLGFTGKPEQLFFLFDKEHGKTVVAPIFVE